jgi:hypothetical protein
MALNVSGKLVIAWRLIFVGQEDGWRSSSLTGRAFALKRHPIPLIPPPQLRYAPACNGKAIRNSRWMLTGDQGRDDGPVTSAAHLEPLVEINAKGRQIWHRRLSIGNQNFPPSVGAIARPDCVFALDSDPMPPVTCGRHHILGSVLMTANVPSGANVPDRKIGQGTGTNDVEFSLGRRFLISRAGAGNRFCCRLLTSVGGQSSETDLRVGLDCRQKGKKTSLPIA